MILPKLIDLFAGAFNIDTTSDDTKLKLAAINIEAAKIGNELLLAQVSTNTAEANAVNRKWITWREMVGYTCAFALAYHFLILQFLSFLFNAAGHPVALPPLQISELMALLFGMLGLRGGEIGSHLIDSKFNSPAGVPPTE